MAYEFFDIEKELERLIPVIAELSAQESRSNPLTWTERDRKELCDLRREFYWLLSSQRVPRTYHWENTLAFVCREKRLGVMI